MAYSILFSWSAGPCLWPPASQLHRLARDNLPMVSLSPWRKPWGKSISHVSIVISSGCAKGLAWWIAYKNIQATGRRQARAVCGPLLRRRRRLREKGGPVQNVRVHPRGIRHRTVGIGKVRRRPRLARGVRKDGGGVSGRRRPAMARQVAGDEDHRLRANIRRGWRNGLFRDWHGQQGAILEGEGRRWEFN